MAIPAGAGRAGQTADPTGAVFVDKLLAMSYSTARPASPLFHLSWVLGLVPLAAIAYDLAVGGSDLIGSLGVWLFAFPLIGVIPAVIWRNGRPTRQVVLALVPAAISALVLLVLLGFANR